MSSRKNEDSVPTLNGSFAFWTGQSNSTGNAFADALVGNFVQYTEAERNREAWFRFTEAEFCVQDCWKVTRRFFLDLGVRYQYMQP